MSVAEKLKEQDAQKHWTIFQWRERYGDEWPIESGRLLAALPQIVAVVEAAEPFARFDETPGFSPQTDALKAALSALEEALS